MVYDLMDDQRSIYQYRASYVPKLLPSFGFICIHYNIYIWLFQAYLLISIVHLFWLVIVVIRLTILDIIVSLCVGHRLIHVRLVLSLLHVQWEILVVTIHIGGICIGKSLV